MLSTLPSAASAHSLVDMTVAVTPPELNMALSAETAIAPISTTATTITNATTTRMSTEGVMNTSSSNAASHVAMDVENGAMTQQQQHQDMGNVYGVLESLIATTTQFQTLGEHEVNSEQLYHKQNVPN
jgi:hypothetical protein